jgi:hypothetical protein
MSAPQTDPAVEYTRRDTRYHVTARDWVRGILFLATVVAFGAGAFLGFGLIFGLLFNRYTIHPIFFFFGWLAFRHGFAEYRNRLAVSGTATAKASSAAIGLVELSGRAHVEYPTEAPVTRTLCAMWKVEVLEKGEKSFRWVELTWNAVMKRASAPLDTLVLEDDTGRVLVWGRDAEIIPIRDVWRSDRGEAPDHVKRLVEALGRQWPSRWSRSPIKVTEERIEQGGPLYVIGTLAERRQIPSARKGFFAALLDKWAPPSGAAPPPTADSLASTFAYARKVGLGWFARDLRPLCPVWSPPQMAPHEVLVWKGDQRRPFIVSGVLESQAVSALSRRAWLYLFGGAALMAWMLWEFLEKLTGHIRW